MGKTILEKTLKCGKHTRLIMVDIDKNYKGQPTLVIYIEDCGEYIEIPISEIIEEVKKSYWNLSTNEHEHNNSPLKKGDKGGCNSSLRPLR